MHIKGFIEQQLSDLFEFDEILATLLIRVDGTILFSQLPETADINIINGIEWIQNTTRIMANELQTGNLKKLVVELQFGNVVIHVAGPNTVLVAVTKTRINLGLLLIEISRRAMFIGKIDKW
ncbi:MAG: hypothetical protein ACFFDT_20880 [Candidatus Hodarchaeota archaeon]